MPSASDALYYLVHVQELRAVIQWKLRHNPVHKRDRSRETPNTRTCFDYLNNTGRSFAAVIQELHPELLMPVCLFYLVLRGLDTIEDDTSISAKKKEPTLRNFHTYLEVDGWTYTENRPEEKDRDLLLNFDLVVREFKQLKQAYKDIIADCTQKMGNGMADYCLNSEFNEEGVEKIEDYDLYCYYVAGLLGEGLTRMFVESKLGDRALLDRPQQQVSMGLFLQKTNIIRDVKEDFDDDRTFWPREIWSKYVEDFGDLLKPEYREQALICSSDMVLNALGHADESLLYLAGLREQSVFNFCAIPQSMAIATLALCFRNPKMFEGNIKITKGEACQLMIQSTQNLQVLSEVFRKYSSIIRQNNVPHDPNFVAINVACGKIEQCVQTMFPVDRKKQLDAADAQAKRDVAYLLAMVFGIMLMMFGSMVGLAWLFGARFDLLFDDLKPSNWENLWKPIVRSNGLTPKSSAAHDEL